MKTRLKLLLMIISLITISCGGNNERKDKEQTKLDDNNTIKTETSVTEETPTNGIDMSNKGIGPVKSVDISEPINLEMVKRGEAIYIAKCMACHKPQKKFIGPAPVGVLERRSPEWIMNMIMNPEEMTQKDPIAKQLLIDHNGAPMANQSITETEARDILEYFRTLKKE